MPRDFREIVDDLRSDGALHDFNIHATNRTDWNAVLRRSRSNREEDCFTVNGESRELPQTFEVIEHLRQEASLCWSVLVVGAHVNCHFFVRSRLILIFARKIIARWTDGQRSVNFFRRLSMWLENPASSPTKIPRIMSSIDLNPGRMSKIKGSQSGIWKD